MNKPFSIRSQVLIAGPPGALPSPDRPTYRPGFSSAPGTVSVLNSSRISASELSVLGGCSTDRIAVPPIPMTCTPKPKLASTLDTGSGSALSSAGMRPFFFFFFAPSAAAGSLAET